MPARSPAVGTHENDQDDGGEDEAKELDLCIAKDQAAEAAEGNVTATRPKKSSQCQRFYNEVSIIVFLGIYGVLQERMMSEPYGQDFFRSSVFLVFCNRLFAIFYTLVVIHTSGGDFRNTAPLWKYLAISSSNVAGAWCQYESLKYVSFPVQTLGKSFKMMPVMVWGLCLSQRKYGVKDWAVAGAVTVGVATFLLTGEVKSRHSNSETSIGGLLLLLGFVACDGFTSSFQEKLFKDHETSTNNQMLYVNLGSAFVSAFTLLVTGAFPYVVRFSTLHPEFLTHNLMLSATAVAGQTVIYKQVKEYGALSLAATMNVRQILSIGFSCIYYSHPVTILQIFGIIVVFGALFYKSWSRGSKKGGRVAAIQGVEGSQASVKASTIGNINGSSAMNSANGSKLPKAYFDLVGKNGHGYEPAVMGSPHVNGWDFSPPSPDKTQSAIVFRPTPSSSSSPTLLDC